MPRLMITEGALAGLSRCRAALVGRHVDVRSRAGRALAELLRRIECDPLAGRPLRGLDGLRAAYLALGRLGFAVLYRYQPGDGHLALLAVAPASPTEWAMAMPVEAATAPVPAGARRRRG